VGDLLKAGISSLKIEGRAKSAYYVAVAVRAYRKVIDALEKNIPEKELKKIITEQKKELGKLAHRGYSTGFLLGKEPAHNFKSRNNDSGFQFVGEVEGKSGKLNILRIHNQVAVSDEIEAITPEKNIRLKIKKIFDCNQKEVEVANGGHNKRYFFQFDKILNEGDLLRKIQ
jgi:putative protease